MLEWSHWEGENRRTDNQNKKKNIYMHECMRGDTRLSHFGLLISNDFSYHIHITYKNENRSNCGIQSLSVTRETTTRPSPLPAAKKTWCEWEVNGEMWIEADNEHFWWVFFVTLFWSTFFLWLWLIFRVAMLWRIQMWHFSFGRLWLWETRVSDKARVICYPGRVARDKMSNDDVIWYVASNWCFFYFILLFFLKRNYIARIRLPFDRARIQLVISIIQVLIYESYDNATTVIISAKRPRVSIYIYTSHNTYTCQTWNQHQMEHGNR